MLASFPVLSTVHFLHTVCGQKLNGGKPGNEATFHATSPHTYIPDQIYTIHKHFLPTLYTGGSYIAN